MKSFSKTTIQCVLRVVIAIMFISFACHYANRNIMLYVDTHVLTGITFRSQIPLETATGAISDYIKVRNYSYSNATNRINFLTEENIINNKLQKNCHYRFAIEIESYDRNDVYIFYVESQHPSYECEIILDSINSTDVKSIPTHILIMHIHDFQSKFLNKLNLESHFYEVPFWKGCIVELNKIFR